jgi:lysophospholipase
MTKRIDIYNFWQTLSQQTIHVQGHQLAYAYAIPNDAKAAITLVNGRIECYLKYKELAFDLYQQGFAVFLIDHLGQGLSERLLSDKQKGHIDSFNTFTTGLAVFIDEVVTKKWQGPHYLLAHSMGCAISYLYLSQYPHPFRRCVLSAPMFGFPTNGLPVALVKPLVSVLGKLGLNEHYMWGQSSYQNIPFEGNSLTSCKTRYTDFKALYDKQPEIKLGGVTVGWLNSALDATHTIKNTAPTIPTLLLQAQGDTIVLNSAQDAHILKYAQISKKIYQNSSHEILFEVDAIRDMAVQDIVTFFNADLCK